jgi:hypothetical protein
VNLDVYVIGPRPLAAGEDPQTAERLPDCTVSLDPAPRHDASRLERVLLGMRDDIDARRARGFNVRVLRVPSVMLTALWFVREDGRADADTHFVPVEPAPYFFEAGQEYALREFRDLLVEPARRALRSNEINRAFIERLDRETEHSG